ncbi:hypothetical protein PsorP6_006781 [Peronosclerospora sorghi]|uniref:Uncharacterized protein n=1 Tax=Peronosclerospora sorghi TaxID=230839 RepID=A0ACC0W2W6_9STRA|nr:hypothetical protein PsorP6_006781 [Peronosclerospora sorghi]
MNVLRPHDIKGKKLRKLSYATTIFRCTSGRCRVSDAITLAFLEIRFRVIISQRTSVFHHPTYVRLPIACQKRSDAAGEA